LRVTLGFIIEDGNEIVAVGIFAFDILQRRPDRPRKIAALDLVAGQANCPCRDRKPAFDPSVGRRLRAGRRSRTRWCRSTMPTPAPATATGRRRRIVGPKAFSRNSISVCIVSSGPVVRGRDISALPAVDHDLDVPGGRHTRFMHGLAMVSGLGSIQMKLSRLGILTFGKLSRSADEFIGDDNRSGAEYRRSKQ